MKKTLKIYFNINQHDWSKFASLADEHPFLDD